MSTKLAFITAAVAALVGCTSDTGGAPAPGFDPGHPSETALTSLSEAEGVALCDAANAWLNDATDFARLAAVSQSLQSEDPVECERLISVYEEVSTDETGDVPAFSEGCGVVGGRLVTCPQSVGDFRGLFEWIATDVDYQNSMLSCDIADMPEVWREIAWTDRTPEEYQPLWSCMLGR